MAGDPCKVATRWPNFYILNKEKRGRDSKQLLQETAQTILFIYPIWHDPIQVSSSSLFGVVAYSTRAFKYINHKLTFTCGVCVQLYFNPTQRGVYIRPLNDEIATVEFQKRKCCYV